MSATYPLRFQGKLDPTTSRWLWIIKGLLVIPHALALTVLYACSLVAWVISFVAILVAGRYPRALFDYNVGVLRWSWRVSFYSWGAFATDQYPPFSLQESDYPAWLEVEYPERLNRLMVLVKWLLAVPRLIILAFLVDGTMSYLTHQDGWANRGLISILALVAAVTLTLSGRYPRGLFDLLMGLNRWVFRVGTYLMLMTDEYPPFRLDLGQDEPATDLESPIAPQDRP
jgi:hypothetical protein